VSGLSPPWDIVIKVAVEADDEIQARSIADTVVDAMDIVVDITAGAPPFVQFEDGTWATEIKVSEPVFRQDEPGGTMDALLTLTANLRPLTWRSGADTPVGADSANVAQAEWPPGFWTVAGRPETLVHPAVRAMLLQARRGPSPVHA